jgi:hypothetical protein
MGKPRVLCARSRDSLELSEGGANMRRHATLLGIVLVGASAATAQSLYAFDPTLTVTELSGPPAPPCAYPAGPVNSAFPTAGVLCPAVAAFPLPLGDVAVDVLADNVYVSDGVVIAAYSRFGAHLGTAFPPLPGITGMAVAAPGLLWITDGVLYGAVPLGLGCPVGPLPFVVGPFPVPIGPIFAGPIGDLDFDPTTGSLLACDALGIVGSFFPGAAGVGPFGVFPVAPGACGLAPGLMGIAFDKALPGTGTFYVTDGVTVARLLPGGVPAPLTFYSPVTCFPVPTGAPVVGLAFAGRQIPFGFGADNSGLPVPVIGSVGQSYAGNPAYSVTLAGSVPGGLGLLRYSFGAACPPLGLLGVPLYLLAPRFAAVNAPVGPLGTAAFVTPIPPAGFFGPSVYLQWIVLTGVSIQVTSGAELRVILP